MECPSSFVETVSEPTMESMIDSMHAVDGNIEEFQDMFVPRGFFQKAEVDLGENLTPVTRGFFQKEGVDLVEAFALVAGGFEVHGQDARKFRLKKAEYGLVHAPQVWYFRIDEFLLKVGFSKFRADVNSLFDRSDIQRSLHCRVLNNPCCGEMRFYLFKLT